MEANDTLIAILKKSHEQAMTGQTLSADQVKVFMKNKIDSLVK